MSSFNSGYKSSMASVRDRNREKCLAEKLSSGSKCTAQITASPCKVSVAPQYTRSTSDGVAAHTHAIHIPASSSALATVIHASDVDLARKAVWLRW